MQTNASSKWLLILGSINMFLAVALGAFGAHALKTSLPPDLMAVYHTGNQYHFYHALGLFGVAKRCPQPSPVASGCRLMTSSRMEMARTFSSSWMWMTWVGHRRFAIGVIKSNKSVGSVAQKMRHLARNVRMVFDYLRMSTNSCAATSKNWNKFTVAKALKGIDISICMH